MKNDDFVEDVIRMIPPVGEPYLEFGAARSLMESMRTGVTPVVHFTYEYNERVPAHRQELTWNGRYTMVLIINPEWRKFEHDVLKGLMISTLINNAHWLTQMEIVFKYMSDNDHLEKCIEEYKINLGEYLRKKELRKLKEEFRKQQQKAWREYKRAKRIKENKSNEIMWIENRLRREICIDDVDLEDMDEALAQIIADTLIHLSKCFRSRLKSVVKRTLNSRYEAYVDNNGTRIVFVNKWCTKVRGKDKLDDARSLAAHEYGHTIADFNDAPESVASDRGEFHKAIENIYDRYKTSVNDVRLKMCRILKKENLEYEGDRKNIYKRSIYMLTRIADELRQKGSFVNECEFTELEKELTSFSFDSIDPLPEDSINEFFASAFGCNFDVRIVQPSKFATEVLEITKKYFGINAWRKANVNSGML